MNRLQDWPLRLDAYIAARRDVPFAWGSQDCCQLARGAVQAVTGQDPAAGWGLRPYRTGRGAAGQLARLGGLPALPARAGLAEIPVPFAGRGDLVLCLNEGRPTLGVALADRAAFAGKQGLEFLPIADCTQAWRVC